MAKRQINNKIVKMIQDYIKVLITEGIAVDQAIVFGSYAKGTAKSYSDIDLAVISKDFGKDPIEEMMDLGKISAVNNSLIEAIPLNPKDLNERYSTLISEIKTHGQTIPF